MPLSLVETYSSVVLNQNQVAQTTDFKSGTSGSYRQEFFLPADYRRGTESGELRYPDLSGFQLLVQVTDDYATTAAFEYTVEYQVFSLGWIRVAEGTAIGAPTDGQVWMTAYFDEPVEIDQTKAASRWRINFSGRSAVEQPKDVPVDYADGVANVLGNRVEVQLADYEPWPFVFGGSPAFLTYDPADNQAYFSYQQGVEKFWFATPNPLALPHGVKGYTQGSPDTAVTGVNGEGSFCFRVLALAGEEGIDFLGNQYRSVVSRNQSDNISTALGADPDQYWLSKPNPSKFAVENLYFDVRKSGSTTYGVHNLETNPGAESGNISPATSDSGGTGGTTTEFAVVSTDARHGNQCWEFTGTAGTDWPVYFFGTNISAVPGDTYGIRASVKIVGGNASSITLRLRQQSGLAPVDEIVVDEVLSPAVGQWYDLVGTQLVESSVDNVEIEVLVHGLAGQNFVIRYDDLFLQKNPPNNVVSEYFDGTMDGAVWGAALYADSYQLIAPDASDLESVIDRVLVDPITPGAYFSIYYSSEGDPGVSDQAWESKLWTRVPKTFRMERRETHVLPEPIKAKYLKFEFSNLQAQHYAPGNFQQPIRYKKHPKWVLDYFLAQLSLAQGNPFLSESVRVVYDALDLAYNYYLDDLGQEPQSTIDVNNTATATVTNFLSSRTDVSDRIDAATLDKISLVMDGFRMHPALSVTTDSLLADYAKGTVSYNDDYPVEQDRPSALNLPDVSSLNRDSVVIEQNFPVMFFFLTCRHAYREVEAKFSHDRAYFVGVRELAFLRDNYLTAYDATTYIEPNADTQNIERNEFI